MGCESLSERIACSKKVKEALMRECISVFLSHHPEFEGMNLTQNFMLQKVIEFYLEGE